MADPDSAKAALRRFYDAEAAYMASDTRDFAPVADTLSENVLLCEPVSLPYGGEYRGRDGFERWLRAFADTWSSMEVRDSEMFAFRNIVVSRSHVHAKARASGQPADWPLLQYVRIEDGRVTELRPFHWDTAAMLAALNRSAASMETDEFVILVTVPIRRGSEDEYLALVGEVNDHMRHEPTFVNTVLHRSADDPGLFMLHETWRDRANFFAIQMHRPYRARYEARLPELLRAPREIKVFEPLRADVRLPEPAVNAWPLAVLKGFYRAEAAYMSAGGAARGASFDPIAATLDPDVVLYQSPDLPWGGEFRGHAGYADWARQMSDAFDQLEVKDEQLFASGNTVVCVCRLVTRARANGKVIDAPMAQVVTVRGDRIVEFRPFYWHVPDYRAAGRAEAGDKPT